METTRDKLINATFEEVYSNGYQGASLCDILAKAGVHKGSMYHFFANKKEMALTAITEKMVGNSYRNILEKDKPCLEHFFAILRDASRRDFKRGCPLANLVQEMSNLDEDFDRTLKAMYQEFRGVFKSIYDHAVLMNELTLTCNTTKLALFTVVVLEGAILSAKASGDEKDYLDAVECLIDYISSNAKEA